MGILAFDSDGHAKSALEIVNMDPMEKILYCSGDLQSVAIGDFLISAIPQCDCYNPKKS
jgi:hypothetical protein